LIPAVAAGLALIALFINLYWAPASSLNTAHNRIKNLVVKAERDFKNLTEDSVFIQNAFAGTLDVDGIESLTAKPYYLFFYAKDEGDELKLRTWSSQVVLPPAHLIYSTGKEGFIKWQNAYYVWHRESVGEAVALAMIPVKWDYFVTNEYLRNDFTVGNVRSDVIHLATVNFDYGLPVYAISGKHLVSIDKSEEIITRPTHPVAVVLYLACALLMLLFVHSLALFVVRKYGPGWGLLFFFSVILLLRFFTYILPMPLNLRQFELFDPSVYGSSSILPSLGDLLINSLIFLWFSVFLRGRVKQTPPDLSAKPEMQRYAIMVLGSILLVAVTFTSANVIRSLVSDSQISFDVINFFTLNVFS